MGKIMKTLENAILKIRENPNKYIGQPSISRLNLFILGYILRQLEEKREDSKWLDEFQKFVEQKYNITDSLNFSIIIRCFSSSDGHAFEQFYKLLDEFYIKRLNKEVES